MPALPFFGGGLDVTLNGLGRTDGRTDDGLASSGATPLATGDSRAVRGGSDATLLMVGAGDIPATIALALVASGPEEGGEAGTVRRRCLRCL